MSLLRFANGPNRLKVGSPIYLEVVSDQQRRFQWMADSWGSLGLGEGSPVFAIRGALIKFEYIQLQQIKSKITIPIFQDVVAIKRGDIHKAHSTGLS